jgi:hypothetical protein
MGVNIGLRAESSVEFFDLSAAHPTMDFFGICSPSPIGTWIDEQRGCAVEPVALVQCAGTLGLVATNSNTSRWK